MNDVSIRISIITVCLNSEGTIRRTLDSVLSQNFEGYEYIIVDGKSSDDTPNIIRKYQEKYNSVPIYLISEKDNGIYDAMNKGIRKAKGELIGILNSDDWYERGCFNNIWETYKRRSDEYAVYYGMMNVYKGERLSQVQYYDHEFLSEHMINHPTCFVTKRTYQLIGLFDCNYKIAADYDFILRAYERGIAFTGIQKVLTNFSAGGASSSIQTVKESTQIRYRHNIYSKYEFVGRLMLLYIKCCFRWIKGILDYLFG